MRRFLLTLLLIVACNANAVTMRLCMLDHPFPPFTMPDGSGQVDELLRLAAREDGTVIETTLAPRLRCIARFKAGEVDALLAAFMPDRMAYGVFPMAGAAADEARAVGVVRFVIYRKKGSKLQWDGHAFTGVDRRPIGIQTGLAVAQRLRQAGLTVDEGAKTVEQNLEKLARGRVQAVVALEDGSPPLADRALIDQIEVLPMPFDSAPIYLQVQPGYYASNRETVDKLWGAAGRIRASSAFQQYQKRYQRKQAGD